MQNPGEIAPRECGRMFPQIARMKTMILLRRDLLFHLLRLDGAELEFRDLAERIERGIGQQVRRRLRIMRTGTILAREGIG